MNADNSEEKLSKTAEKILSAARAVFAEKGYNGTHMDEIAERASVNKATLYYQIGDKDTLYAEVIHRVIGSVAQDITHAIAAAPSPEEKLKAYIACVAGAIDKNPEIPPIMMREIASGGANMPRLVAVDIATGIITLMGVLEEGAKKGVFIETIPYLVHMMILGAILLYKGSAPIKNRQTWLPAAIRNKDKKINENIAGEVAKLILRAVKK